MNTRLPEPRVALDAAGVCQRRVMTVLEDDLITTAARLMRERHVGYLVVTDPPAPDGSRKVRGVLTDRDIVVSVVARDANPRELKVADVMTRSPLMVGADYSIDTVLCFMRDAGVRRVPVTGEQGELIGVLSIDDVLERLAEQLSNIAGSIRTEQRTERLVRP
jgi:CBS domain-containing protein